MTRSGTDSTNLQINKEDTLNLSVTRAIPAAIASAMLAQILSLPAMAEGWMPAERSMRCPTKWGAEDVRGAANMVTPETVTQAAQLISEGRVFELGKVLEPGIPIFTNRSWSIHTKRTVGPRGRNQQIGNEEVVTTELGQVGTQFDALSHMGIDGDLYNCNRNDEIATRTGFTKLGVENVGALFTRGILLDVAASKGADILEAGYEITVEDLSDAVDAQGTPIKAGDIVLIRTGWGQHYGTDNATFNSGEPGIGTAAAEWLAAKDIVAVGSDNWGVEVVPNPDPDLSFPVHQINLVTYGIYQIENLDLEELSESETYEFAFVIQPLKIKGGTGSTVAPIAIR